MSEIKKIAFIGSGNVATHLAKAFAIAGLEIVGFYGRNQQSTQKLASKHQSKRGRITEMVPDELDFIIISVPDHALEEVIKSLPSCSTLMAHTSGSLSMEVLQTKGDHISVFYPLQTFSKEKEVDFLKIPIMLEANNKNDLQPLENLARKISPKIY